MCRKDFRDWHRHISGLVEKIETLARLNPVIDSDEELALVQATLLSIVGDYATQTQAALNELRCTPGEGEGSA